MNKLCCLIIMFFACGVCDAQNLVPNGSFEQYSGCPNAFGQLDSALFWMNPGYSADYYNQCTSFPWLSVPYNYLGYQQAHSGVAYGGIFVYELFGNDTREYIEAPLMSTLISNACYYFEMYINLGDMCSITTHNIGVYFSDTAITVSNNHPLPFTPQINNTGLAFDTLNWTLVAGNYIAQGGENYLIIGNFNNDANTDTTVLDSSLQYYGVYCYIDDVSLSLCTGIEEQNNDEELKIYPNPFSNKINCRVKENETVEVILFDVTSRKIFNQSFTTSTTINIEQLAKGVYLYEVRNKSGVIKKGKVVKD